MITCQDCFQWSWETGEKAAKCDLPPALLLLLTWSHDKDTMALGHEHTCTYRDTLALGYWTSARGKSYRINQSKMWVFLYKLVAAGRKSLTLSRLNLQAHSAYVSMCLSVCACVCVHTCEPFLLFPIFRKSAGASHSSGPQRMTSYCGFGAPEQLDEFMVSAKKRRSLSFCQSWFPPRFKCWPPWAAKGGRGPEACI